jgi:hypothetical protein
MQHAQKKKKKIVSKTRKHKTKEAAQGKMTEQSCLFQSLLYSGATLYQFYSIPLCAMPVFTSEPQHRFV